MREIYAPLHSLEIPFVVTNVESAELIKYAANGFLATKITFINEIAVVCEKVGANVHDVAIGMGLDSRIGPKFLQAGPGFGGSCFPKDTSAMADISRRHGYDFQIMEAVLRVNDDVKQRMIDKIVDALGGDVNGKTIGILGLAFKPETDDMRDSPTITDHQGPAGSAAPSIRAYDPQAMENAKTMFENVTYCDDAYETAEGADAMVLATEWNEFRALNFERIKNALRQPIVDRPAQRLRPAPHGRARASTTSRSAASKTAARGSADDACIDHRRCGLPRLAPLRAVPRARA